MLSNRGQALNASMGPHSSEQGNIQGDSRGNRADSRWLQWGLTLPSKETIGCTLESWDLHTESLQWGLTLPSKETGVGRNEGMGVG